MKKPREFWIPAAVGGFYDGKECNFAVGPIVDGPLPNPGGIWVREVASPDYKEIAEKLARYLEEIADNEANLPLKEIHHISLQAAEEALEEARKLGIIYS